MTKMTLANSKGVLVRSVLKSEHASVRCEVKALAFIISIYIYIFLLISIFHAVLLLETSSYSEKKSRVFIFSS